MEFKHKPKKQTAAKIMLTASMVIFGTLAPFVRGVSVSSAELALYRAVLAAALIGIFLLVTRQKIDFKSIKKELPLLAASGAAMGFNWILLFEAYKYTTVSAATLSYYFAPVLVTVVCPFLFKEKLGIKQIVCFIMSTAGVALIVGASGGGKSDFLGVMFGLGAAFLYAGVVILNKYIKNVGGIHRTFLQFFAAVFVLLPYALITSGINIAGLDARGVVCLLIVGLFHTGVTYCMYFSSLSELSGEQAAVLSYIDPLVAVLVSVIFLGESITLPQMIGGALILGFAALNEIKITKKEKKE